MSKSRDSLSLWPILFKQLNGCIHGLARGWTKGGIHNVNSVTIDICKYLMNIVVFHSMQSITKFYFLCCAKLIECELWYFPHVYVTLIVVATRFLLSYVWIHCFISFPLEIACLLFNCKSSQGEKLFSSSEIFCYLLLVNVFPLVNKFFGCTGVFYLCES